MTDPILISQIIAAEGLSGEKAAVRRAELEKLPASELPNLLAQISGSNRLNASETFEKSTPDTTAQKSKTEIINELEQQVLDIEINLKQLESQNGFIGFSWDWLKNTTGLGDSSDKVRKELAAMKQQIQEYKNNPFAIEPPETNAQQALDAYKDGQEMAADITGDLVSGVAAVGIYTAAVAAAPFTGGTSIVVGVAAAATTGAAIKTGLKYADAKSGGREYNTTGYDLATGAFSGVLAPVTGGMGGAAGKTVAKAAGLQVIKTVGKETVETTAETGLKQFTKNLMLNPAGYEYAGGTMLKRTAAAGMEMAVDGALGGGFKAAGKAGNELGIKIKGKGASDELSDAVIHKTPEIILQEKQEVMGILQRPSVKNFLARKDAKYTEAWENLIDKVYAENPQINKNNFKKSVSCFLNEFVLGSDKKIEIDLPTIEMLSARFSKCTDTQLENITECASLCKHRDMSLFPKLIKSFDENNMSPEQIDALLFSKKHRLNYATTAPINNRYFVDVTQNLIETMPELKKLPPEQLEDMVNLAYLSRDKNLLSSLSDAERQRLHLSISSLPESVKASLIKNDLKVDLLDMQLTESKVLKGYEVAADKVAQNKFTKSVLANNNPHAENILKSTEFKDFLNAHAKDGLLLKYPRETFIKDLNLLLEQLPSSEREKVLAQLNIKLDDNSYEGLLKSADFN